MKKIITDKNYLNIPTEKVLTLEEGELIASELFLVLNTTKTGIALTANQIGINKSVFVVNVKDPLYFINPEIINKSNNQIIYKESCLSLPKYNAITKRYQWIEIKADNLEKPAIFGNIIKDYSKLDSNSILTDIDLLECIAIQHEYDHTKGILISDINLTIKNKPIIVNEKYGRNDKITITKDDSFEIIKFKHLDKYLNNGWKLS